MPRNNFGTSAALSLLWLILFYSTGDPRLFFPFTMQLALQLGFQRGPSGSAWIAAVFLLIRLVQGATWKVLSVELVVAAIVISICLAAFSRSSKSTLSALGWAAFGSILAFLGLAL